MSATNGRAARPRTPIPTVAGDVFQRLRVDLLQGRYDAGARLRFAQLTANYQASSGVLREALTRLAEQGLVEATPQHGFRVITVSIRDVLHLTEARVAIEGVALRQSVEHGDVRWESAVVAAHHTLSRTNHYGSEREINPEWLDVHADFHKTLLSGCPNPRLREITSLLRDVSEIYRCRSHRADLATNRDVASEHRALADACLARDADGAVDALTTHIELTTELFIKSESERLTDDESEVEPSVI